MAFLQNKAPTPKGESAGVFAKITAAISSAPKAAVIAGAVGVVAAVGIVCGVAFGGGKSNSKANTPVTISAEEDSVRSMAALYSNVIQDIDGLDNRTFTDSSVALAELTSAFNDVSEGSNTISYIEGESYARTSDLDPFGTAYYITAKQDNPTAESSTFSFYMTSAGANKSFDVDTFRTDDDDISIVILSGKGISTAEPKASTDFGLAEIIANKPTDDRLNHNEEVSQPVKTSTLPAKVTLTLNNQGGSGGTTNIRVRNGNSLTNYSVDVPSKENYEFMGYYTGAEGNGTKIFDSMGVGTQTNAAFEGNSTLYAYWVGMEVLIHFDNAGGSGRESVTARYGATMPRVVAPTRASYYFIGYYSQPDGKGTKYYDSNGNGVYSCDISATTMLYAFWSAQAYTVQHFIMNKDGSYPATPNKTENMAHRNNTTVSMNSLVDQTFVVKNGIVYSSGRVNGTEANYVTVNDNNTIVSLYYSRCSYKVTVLAGDDGVSEVTGDGDYLYGQRVTLNAKLADGYSWNNWRNTETNGIASTSQKYQFDMGTSALTLEATTSPATYTIKLDPNGGSCRVKEISVRYNANYYSELPTNATRTGYVLSGWSAKKGETETIDATAKYTTKNDTTLYAVWTPDEYEISFDFQGGQGGTKEVTAKYDTTLPSIAALPTRKGYSFMGYYQSKDGKGIQYYDANGKGVIKSDFTESTTLYAYWSSSSVSIAYYDQGGGAFSGTQAFGYPTSAKYGTLTNLKTPTKVGYNFIGWFTNAECTGKAVTSVMADTYSGNIVLFAKWTVKSTIFTFDMDKSDVTIPDNLKALSIKYGDEISDLEPNQIPTNNKYVFNGFYTAKNGKGTIVFDCNGVSCVQKNTFSSNTTLYASWSNSITKVSFSAEDTGVNLPSSLTTLNVAYDASFPNLKSNQLPSGDGFTFDGFYTGKNGTGTKIYDKNGISTEKNTFDDALTLYAKIDVVTITISFDMDNSELSKPASLTTIRVQYGKAIDDLNNEQLPDNEGYIFRGFYTKRNGNGVEVFTKDGISLISKSSFTTDITLYACNEVSPIPEIPVLLSLDKQGGEGGTESVQSISNKILPDIIVPSKEGYTFMGYFTDVNGQGIKMYGADGKCVNRYTTAEDTTFYAYWIENIGTEILFSWAGLGTTWVGAPSKVMVATDELVPDLPSVPYRVNYAFDGFYDKSSGLGGLGTKFYDSEGHGLENVSDDTVLILYANFNRLSVPIVYKNSDGSSFDGTEIWRDSNNNSEVTPDEVAYVGAEIKMHLIPEKTGFVFDGWYYDSNCNEPVDNAPVISEVDYYSKYKALGEIDFYAKWISD